MSIPMSPFLRNTLLADAATGAIAAVPTIAASGFLSALLGIPAWLVFWAGIALVPVVAFLLAMAGRGAVPRAWLREIVVINGAWAIASFGVLAFGLVSPNALGTLFIVAQALAVGVFAALQFSVLRAARPLVA